jgi:hypothetical protein
MSARNDQKLLILDGLVDDLAKTRRHCRASVFAVRTSDIHVPTKAINSRGYIGFASRYDFT